MEKAQADLYTKILLPIREIYLRLDELNTIAQKAKGEAQLHILEYCLEFVQYQFGERIANRRNGSDNWMVEIVTFLGYCEQITVIYDAQSTRKNLSDANLKIVYKKLLCSHEKSLTVLEPWMTQIDLEKSQRTYIFTEEKFNHICRYLSASFIGMAVCFSYFQNFEKTEENSQKGIFYAKKLVNDEKAYIQYMHEALILKGDNDKEY